MCDKIEYEMHMDQSKILGCNNKTLNTTFNPFQRGFFTLLEQRIDAAILNVLYWAQTEQGPPEIHDEDAVTFEDIIEDTEVSDSKIVYGTKSKNKSGNLGDFWGKTGIEEEHHFKPGTPKPPYGNSDNQLTAGNSYIDPFTDKNVFGNQKIGNDLTYNPVRQFGDTSGQVPGGDPFFNKFNNRNSLPNQANPQHPIPDYNNNRKSFPNNFGIPSDLFSNTENPQNEYKNHGGGQRERTPRSEFGVPGGRSGNAGGQAEGGNMFHNNTNNPTTLSTTQQTQYNNMSGPGFWRNLTPSQLQQNPNNFNPGIQENQQGNLGGRMLGSDSKQIQNPGGGILDSQNVFFRPGNSAMHSNDEKSSHPGSLSSFNSLSFLGGVGQSLGPGLPASHAMGGSTSKVSKQVADSTQDCDVATQSLLNSMFFSLGSEIFQEAPSLAPVEHVAKVPFALFGIIPTELQMLQTPSSTAGIHQRVTLPGTLSLGTLLPSLAGSPLDAIILNDTTLTYRSNCTPTVPAGLTLATTIQLSGFLDPVNTVLRDVFHQERPRLEVSGLISTRADCLKHIPAPSGFTLRGALPEVKINMFGVLNLTELGVSIMGCRKGSAGGYDYSYGFDGRGRIADIDVNFSMTKHHDDYDVFLAMTGEIWNNVGGLVGVNVR